MSGDEILKKRYTEPEWLVDQFLLKGGVTAIYGAQGVGKSWMDLEFSKTVVGGHSFLGHARKGKPGRVLYYALEDTDSRIKIRLRTQGWKPEEAKRVVFETELASASGDGFKQIREDHAETYADLVVVDPLWMYGGARLDFNKGGQVGEMMKKFKTFARDVDAAVVLTHHTRKATKFAPAGNLDDDASGSRALSALTDVRILIDRSPNTLNTKIFVAGKDRAYETIMARLDVAAGVWRTEDEVDGTSLRSRVLADLKKNGPASATAVADRMDEHRPNVSQALVALFNEGKATRSREGKEVIYCLKL